MTGQIVNNDVMNAVSTSQFRIMTDGGAIFSGVVSLENNRGFCAVALRQGGPVFIPG